MRESEFDLAFFVVHTAVASELARPANMLNFETFKEKLGDLALTMTDEEVKRLMEQQEQVADALFSAWVNEKC